MALLPILLVTLHSTLAFGHATTQNPALCHREIPRVSWSELQSNPALSKTFINSPAIITHTPLHEWLSGIYKDTENRKPWLWLKEHLSSGSSNLTVSQEVENILSSLDHTLKFELPIDYSHQNKGDFTFFSDEKRDDDIHQPTKRTERVQRSEIFAQMRCDASVQQKGCDGAKFQVSAHRLAPNQKHQSNAMHMPPIQAIDDLRMWLKQIDPVLGRSPGAVKTKDSLFWLGTKGSRSRMHYDVNHNFVLQLAGRKEWFLSSLANFSYRGYPTQHSHARQHYNRNASLEAKDQFPPHVDRPRQYRFTLSAGEVLWCPDHWLHEVKAVTTSVSLNMWFESWGTVFEDQMRQAINKHHFSKYHFDACTNEADCLQDRAERGCSAGGGRHAESFAQGCALLINAVQEMLTRLWSVKGTQRGDMLRSIYAIFCRVFMQRYQGGLSESETDDQGLKASFNYNGKLLNARHVSHRIQSAVRKECDDMITHYRYPIKNTTDSHRDVARDFEYQTNTVNAKQSSEAMVEVLQQLIDVEELLETRGDSPELLSPDKGINELWVETVDAMVAEVLHGLNLFTMGGPRDLEVFGKFNYLGSRAFVSQCLLPYTVLYGEQVLQKSLSEDQMTCGAPE